MEDSGEREGEAGKRVSQEAQWLRVRWSVSGSFGAEFRAHCRERYGAAPLAR